MESAIDEETTNLKNVEKRIVNLFSSKGGKETDSDFLDYGKKFSTTLSEVNASLDSYYELLENAGRIPKETMQDSKDVLQILQSLSDSHKCQSDNQKLLTDNLKLLADNVGKKHKIKELDQPRFDPSHTRQDPLVYKQFITSFTIFT